MGQVRPRRRLTKVSRFLTSKPRVQRRIGLLATWRTSKIAWKLRRSSLHRGRPSPIFRWGFEFEFSSAPIHPPLVARLGPTSGIRAG
ncbi:hypothetical protein U9M48_013487 [Paspalum notatum var. saurae]|uniref:Uncharacterized protein n=1 Tax=Paspalum notatum var. saurae TaxID=547442 RepID=A0AAQ3SZB5_PASNO